MSNTTQSPEWLGWWCDWAEALRVRMMKATTRARAGGDWAEYCAEWDKCSGALAELSAIYDASHDDAEARLLAGRRAYLARRAQGGEA